MVFLAGDHLLSSKPATSDCVFLLSRRPEALAFLFAFKNPTDRTGLPQITQGNLPISRSAAEQS